MYEHARSAISSDRARQWRAPCRDLMSRETGNSCCLDTSGVRNVHPRSRTSLTHVVGEAKTFPRRCARIASRLVGT
jgi:hypothetical protein